MTMENDRLDNFWDLGLWGVIISCVMHIQCDVSGEIATRTSAEPAYP